MKGANLMKFRRAALFGTTTAFASVATLATGLALFAGPAKAEAATVNYATLEWCNDTYNNSTVAIDAWAGGTFLGKALAGNQCNSAHYEPSVSGATVQFFLDNRGIQVGSVTFQGDQTILVVFSGNLNDVQQRTTVLG
jgi:hypothetical protein